MKPIVRAIACAIGYEISRRRFGPERFGRTRATTPVAFQYFLTATNAVRRQWISASSERLEPDPLGVFNRSFINSATVKRLVTTVPLQLDGKNDPGRTEAGFGLGDTSGMPFDGITRGNPRVMRSTQ
jgi:hypothetical protein